MKNLTFILTIILVCLNFACGSKTSPIVGTWERTDKKIEAVDIYSANGDWEIKSSAISHRGRYEIKDGTLRTILIDKITGKENPFDEKYKIVELNEDKLILELTDGNRMTFKKVKN
jgi:hypothetical protein